jgi:hypothetical protein
MGRACNPFPSRNNVLLSILQDYKITSTSATFLLNEKLENSVSRSGLQQQTEKYYFLCSKIRNSKSTMAISDAFFVAISKYAKGLPAVIMPQDGYF